MDTVDDMDGARPSRVHSVHPVHRVHPAAPSLRPSIQEAVLKDEATGFMKDPALVNVPRNRPLQRRVLARFGQIVLVLSENPPQCFVRAVR